MKKSIKFRGQNTDPLQTKQPYSSPTIQVLSIAMEYSIASGSGAGNVDSGSVTKEWNQESVQSKDLNW